VGQFWDEIFGRFVATKVLGKNVQRKSWEDQMGVRGTSHDYFDEAARTRQEIDEVRNQVEHFGYKVHSMEGEERVVIGVVGVGDVPACMESANPWPQVEKVVRISAPYKL